MEKANDGGEWLIDAKGLARTYHMGQEIIRALVSVDIRVSAGNMWLSWVLLVLVNQL